MRLFVVVPFYNEAALLPNTLDALGAQSDTDFTLVLVDNASSDASRDVALAFIRQHAGMRIDLIAEPRKGTGVASDTGFRHAIASGATHVARTDADCLPERDWVRNIRRAFREHGLEFVAGAIKPRTDDFPLGRWDRVLIPTVLWLAVHTGRLRRRGPQFKYPYILAAGNNLAITAALYERAGGFPRTSIEHEHEDRVLSERVRTLTRRGGVRADIVVYNSTRRMRRYGYARTVAWYVTHRGGLPEVDVR
jgi:glycosyltransferase involved in cell wall biosynthesis